MKILITGDNGECLPPPYGGIIKRCLLHAKIWKTKGAEVYIHIYRWHEKEEDLGAGARYFYDFLKTPTLVDKIWFGIKKFFTSPFLFIRLFYLQLKLSGEFNFSRFFYCAARAVNLDQRIKDINPDIIITETGGLQSLVALEIAKKHKIPIILENYAEIQYKEISERNISVNIADRDKEIWRYLVNGVDLVVSASEHCAEGPRKYIKNPAKTKIVYSGVNFDIFNGHITNDKISARKKFALPLDKFLVMAVGAIRFRKGHDQLIEALLKLPTEQINKITVVLCGMGPIDELKQKVQEIGFPLEQLKVFQGLTEEDLAELYSGVDCFCFPSITPRECMGMAMKEAMSIGLPIVAYDSGGIKEAIEHEVNGFLAPSGDKKALAEAVTKIMNLNEDGKKMFRENNIIKAQKLFDIKNTASQLYEEILKIVEKI